MVTETIPVREQEQEVLPILDVCEVGERIGVPVVIRPWWGSRRQLYVRRHRKCGEQVFRGGGWWCYHCGVGVATKDIDVVRLDRGRWVCPAGWVQLLKWPAVEGDKVVMWEGRCGERYFAAQIKRYGSTIHVHRQTLEVIDFSSVAMLARVSVNNHRLNFLIGRDDGRPFVQVVTRNQTTVAEAYDFLMPTPVFQAQMHGFYCPRQGDWYFVPREFWTSRPIGNVERRVRPWPGRLDSAMSSGESGTIYSNAPIDRTRHVAELYIWTWPFSMVKGTVTAPDHPPVKLETWHRAIRVRQTAAVNRDAAGDGD